MEGFITTVVDCLPPKSARRLTVNINGIRIDFILIEDGDHIVETRIVDEVVFRRWALGLLDEAGEPNAALKATPRVAPRHLSKGAA